MDAEMDLALLAWLKDFAGQGVLTTDTRLIIVGWNRWLETHSGRGAAAVIGRDLLGLYPQLVERRLDQFYLQALGGQAAVLAQRFHRYLLPFPADADNRLSGQMQQTARIAPLYSNGRIIGTVTAIEDVTERVEREDELRRARDEVLQVAGQLEVRVQQRTAELAQAREQLQQISRRLIEIQENERRAIARELHDEVGQQLTSLTLSIAALEREQPGALGSHERLQDIRQMIDGILSSIHSMAVSLRPASLDRVGLVPALDQLIETISRQSEIAIDLVTTGIEGARWPSDVETALYRVVQEALTNAARHARAQNVAVILTQHESRAVVVIEDDGVGFDTLQASQSGRLGLLGMRERLEMLGGSLTIESAPGAGTTLYAEVTCSAC